MSSYPTISDGTRSFRTDWGAKMPVFAMPAFIAG